MLLKSEEESKIKNSDGGLSQSMGWYLKYHKSNSKLMKPSEYTSHHDKTESEIDTRFNFSRTEQQLMKTHQSRNSDKMSLY